MGEFEAILSEAVACSVCKERDYIEFFAKYENGEPPIFLLMTLTCLSCGYNDYTGKMSTEFLDAITDEEI